MNKHQGFRDREADELRKSKRLEPIRKSGKERHELYTNIDQDEDDEPLVKRESILDYLDDEEEE